MTDMFDALTRIAETGGPVVLILIAVSVVTLAVVLYKLWQFSSSGVGRHVELSAAVRAWDAGDRTTARAALDRSTSYLAPVIGMAFVAGPDDGPRLEAEAETRFARLERGLRYLDSVAQLAPLLGLFGTVLGMIEAFQALQDAGSQVDPSVLAGGIWVALLTTAVGLVVAMPTSVVLNWFEGRMDAERVIAGRAIQATRRRPGPCRSMRRARRASRMSMTSLIDVIFLLLLFFMISSTFSRFSELDLMAGGTSAGAPADRPPLFLRLSPGDLSLNGKALALTDLRGALEPEADADSPRPVIVALATDVTAQRLTDVLAALRGIQGIAPTVLGTGR